MDEFLPSLGILESNTKHQLLESLYSIGEKSSIPAKIKGFLNALQNELVSGKRGMNWSAFILAEVKKFDTNFKDDNDVLRQGMYYSQIHSNRTNIMNNTVGDPARHIIGGIEKQINSLVNDSTRGVFYAINVLRRLQFILSNENFNYIPRFEKDIQDLQIVISKLDSEVKRRFQDLREDESMSKVNMLKKAAMTGTLEKLIKTLDEYYNSSL